jgi:tetraacyldisaccharide 4'-kinase
MNRLVHRLAERVRRNEPIPLPLAAVLTAATPAVRFGMWGRRLRAATRVDARVISFGNVSAGGAGKTPAVIERARLEMAQGRKVAVLTRGYGSRQRPGPVAVDTAKQAEDLYAVLGDEPALIARKVPGVVIVKCADRVAAAHAAIRDYGCDTLILDDGFQYVRLVRDEDIVVIDATNPFGNGHLIPRGILREPIEALRRATAILLTRCDQASNVPGLIAELRDLGPGVPIRTTRHAPASLWRVSDGAQMPLDAIRGRPVRAVCAIANPEAFFATLESLGASIRDRIPLPDHYEIPAAALMSSDMVVVTEKDAVRMMSTPNTVYALGVELEDCRGDDSGVVSRAGFGPAE